MAETKYGKYIVKMPLRDKLKEKFTLQGPPEQFTGFGGNLWTEIQGLKGNFSLGCIAEPMIIPAYPHKHPEAEILFFIGGNPADPLDFRAEIHIALGDEWEKHVITTTSVVCIPGEFTHCPVMVMKVEQPILFGAVMIDPRYLTDAPPNMIYPFVRRLIIATLDDFKD
jgi:hypothetical protein